MSEEINREDIPSEDQSLGNFKDLPEKLQILLGDENIPNDTKELLLEAYTETIEIYSSFSGPLPPPDQLERYNNAVENGAERIMVMTEEQSSHRRTMEGSVVRSQNRQSETGQWMAFIIAILVLGSSVALGFYGQTAVACVLGGSTIVSLAYVFIAGKKLQNEDLKNKL